MTNKEVLDNASLQRALTRITYEIIERNKGGQDLILVGIKTRGEFLAQRIASRLEQLEGVKIPVMAIDVDPEVWKEKMLMAFPGLAYKIRTLI